MFVSPPAKFSVAETGGAYVVGVWRPKTVNWPRAKSPAGAVVKLRI